MKFANHYLLASILLVFLIGPVAFDYGLLSIVNLEIKVTYNGFKLCNFVPSGIFASFPINKKKD